MSYKNILNQVLRVAPFDNHDELLNYMRNTEILSIGNNERKAFCEYLSGKHEDDIIAENHWTNRYWERIKVGVSEAVVEYFELQVPKSRPSINEVATEYAKRSLQEYFDNPSVINDVIVVMSLEGLRLCNMTNSDTIPAGTLNMIKRLTDSLVSTVQFYIYKIDGMSSRIPMIRKFMGEKAYSTVMSLNSNGDEAFLQLFDKWISEVTTNEV